MAATDARPVPRKNTAFRVYFPIIDADGDLVSGASGLDSEYSIDGAGGSFSDCTNEATEIGSSGTYYLDLTSGEMNGDAVIVIVKTSTSGAKTTPIFLYPEEVGDFRVNVEQFGGSNGTFSSGRPEVNTTLIEGSDATNQIRDAVVDDATRIDASALNTLSGHDPGETIMGATDLGTGSGLTSLASAANLSTVAGYLDTEIAAILADTNELQTDWANGGRLDNILDARASQASVDDLPTNAELATSQAAADDATLAAIAALNNLSAAQVNAEVDAAIETYHLDHLLAATYDPASKPGAADALLNELVESDSGVARFTANALEQAPTGGSAPTAGEIADEVRVELATELARIDVATSTRLASSGYTAPPSAATNASAVRTELTTELGRMDVAVSTRATQTSVDDLPTTAELATALGTADDAVLAAIAAKSVPTAAENATAVLAAANATPIAANVEQVNATPISGTGTSGDKWRPT